VELHEAPHIVVQLYGVPHGILRIFINEYGENVFKILKFLQQTLSHSPEQSTLDLSKVTLLYSHLGLNCYVVILLSVIILRAQLLHNRNQ
jgi:hypothetical protein